MTENDLPVTSIVDRVRAFAIADHPGELRFGRDAPLSSYRQLWREVERKVVGLRRAGLKPGDRVALSMSNTRETVVSLLAVLHSGATLLPFYHRPGLRPRGKDYARLVSLLRASAAPFMVTHEADRACHEAAVVEAGSRARVLAVESDTAADASEPFVASERAVSPGPAFIQFSAGSTAEPKGLCLTHEQLLMNTAGLAKGLGMSAGDRVYSWLPLFHDMGLVAALATALSTGCSLELRTPREFVFNPLGWLRGMSEARSTVTMAPQFAYDLVVGKASVAPLSPGELNLSALRLLLNGAEQIDPLGCARFEAVLAGQGLRPNSIQPGYGLAENCVAVSVRPSLSPRLVRDFDRAALAEGRLQVCAERTVDSVRRAGNGTPVEGTEVVILDEDDRPLAPGCVGEVALLGRCAAREALGSDGELRALPFPLRTGDLGALHEGELFIVGRVKEMVKRGGEALAPADVEQVVSALVGDLGQLAAFGYYDEDTGNEELVVVAESRAFRQPERCAQLTAEIRAAVLREFRIPLREAVVVRPASLPRTTSGKLRRVALRDSFLRGEVKGG